jgi:hypothetical protein
MINLLDFFIDMNAYVIIRIDENFPKFTIGKDDIDILCLNITDTCDHIINIIKSKYMNLNFRKFHIDNKIHIDLLTADNKFIIKFDICDDIRKMYPCFDIDINLTKEVISNNVTNKFKCNIPKLNHELMLRQLEYDMFISKRPDKIKHLNYINNFPNIMFKKFKKK